MLSKAIPSVRYSNKQKGMLGTHLLILLTFEDFAVVGKWLIAHKRVKRLSNAKNNSKV